MVYCLDMVISLDVQYYLISYINKHNVYDYVNLDLS